MLGQGLFKVNLCAKIKKYPEIFGLISTVISQSDNKLEVQLQKLVRKKVGIRNRNIPILYYEESKKDTFL